MNKIYNKNKKQPLTKILIRLFIYPFCIIAIMMAMYSTYLRILEAGNLGEVAGGLILILLFVGCIGFFLYIDIRRLLGLDEKEKIEIGREDILDDEIITKKY